MSKVIETYTSHEQKGILLNANESSKNLPSCIIDEIKDAMNDIAYNRYPDNSQKELLDAYANVIGVKEENLLAGNGSDQMLGLMIGTFLAKDKVLYTFDPDFSMYDYYASCYEASVLKYGLKEDGSLDVDGFIQKGKENNVSLVIFSRPNNPSGYCLTMEEVKQVLDGLNDIPVVVDEAYIEFADEESAITLLDQYSNLYVTRTLSKAYACAGIRVGFLISQMENMKVMKQRSVVYALNSVTMKIASIVCNYASLFQKEAMETKKRRDALYEEIKDMKAIVFYPSQANFIRGKTNEKQKLLTKFEAKNIVIRNYADDTFRITIGTEEENREILDVLRSFEEEV